MSLPFAFSRQWRHDMFFASGQARGLPPVADEEDEEMAPAPRPAARRIVGAGADRLNAFRAAIGAAARGSGDARPAARSAARPAATSRPRVVVEQKKGRGTFTYSRD